MRKIQFVRGNFYHIYNRGTDKRSIFQDDEDRWRFLQGLFLFNDSGEITTTLWDIKSVFGKVNFNTIRAFMKDHQRVPITKILSDCLMPNHFHLLVEETKENGISRFMQKFGTGYTMYFNKKYERSGGLFSGPFKAVMIDSQEQLEYILAYINVLNPAQLVEPNLKKIGINNLEKILDFVEKYLWSTHREYLGLRESVIIEKSGPAEIFNNPKKYLDFITDVLNGKKVIPPNYLFDEKDSE
ncbi:MAG: transposase [bacterium]